MTALELKDLRKKLGLTKVQMAERLGVTRDAIYKYEEGKITISRPVQMLAQILADKIE